MNLPDWLSPYGPIISFGVASALYIIDDIRLRGRNRRLREIVSLHHSLKILERAASHEESAWAVDEAFRLKNELREAEKREGIPR